MSPEERRAVIIDWLRRNDLVTVMTVWAQLGWEEFMGPEPSNPMNLRGPIR